MDLKEHLDWGDNLNYLWEIALYNLIYPSDKNTTHLTCIPLDRNVFSRKDIANGQYHNDTQNNEYYAIFPGDIEYADKEACAPYIYKKKRT